MCRRHLRHDTGHRDVARLLTDKQLRSVAYGVVGDMLGKDFGDAELKCHQRLDEALFENYLYLSPARNTARNALRELVRTTRERYPIGRPITKRNWVAALQWSCDIAADAEEHNRTNAAAHNKAMRRAVTESTAAEQRAKDAGKGAKDAAKAKRHAFSQELKRGKAALTEQGRGRAMVRAPLSVLPTMRAIGTHAPRTDIRASPQIRARCEIHSNHRDSP